MKKRIFTALVACCLLFSLASCSGGNASQEGNSGEALEKVTILLEWTPNTNHTGLYVAQKLGYYERQGLDVSIVQPEESSATTLVAAGKAEFGIGCQDTMVSAFQSETALPITAIAALIQHNTSGIISLKGNGMDRPKGMEGKTYATWGLDMEQGMIKDVVEKDGGDFSKINMVPNNVTDELSALQTNIDAVWVFYAWTGVAAGVKGIDIDYFAFKDLNPDFDYYTPLIISNNDYIEEHPETVKKFLKATRDGYEYAIENPEEAADILIESDNALDEDIVLASQKWLQDQYKAEVERWGEFDTERWDSFYTWLYDQGIIAEKIPSGFGFTNDYLPE